MGVEFDAALCLNRPLAAHRKTCVEGLGFRAHASYFIGAFGLSEESAQPQEKSIGGGCGGAAVTRRPDGLRLGPNKFGTLLSTKNGRR